MRWKQLSLSIFVALYVMAYAISVVRTSGETAVVVMGLLSLLSLLVSFGFFLIFSFKLVFRRALVGPEVLRRWQICLLCFLIFLGAPLASGRLHAWYFRLPEVRVFTEAMIEKPLDQDDRKELAKTWAHLNLKDFANVKSRYEPQQGKIAYSWHKGDYTFHSYISWMGGEQHDNFAKNDLYRLDGGPFHGALVETKGPRRLIVPAVMKIQSNEDQAIVANAAYVHDTSSELDAVTNAIQAGKGCADEDLLAGCVPLACVHMEDHWHLCLMNSQHVYRQGQ